MPTSVTTTLGTDVVNLHYSLPAAEPESSQIVSLNLNNKPIIPISIHSLTPANVVHANTVQIPSETEASQLTTTGSNFLFRPEVHHQLTGSSVTAQFTSAAATPPMTTSYIPNELTTIVDQHRLSEEEFYGEDTINSNLDMALYSPLPHLQFTGGTPVAQHGTPTTLTTSLEDWIKQPNR